MDTFRPATITTDAIHRLKQLSQHPDNQTIITSEPPIENPNTPYPLDPTRGVDNEIYDDTESHDIGLIPADSLVIHESSPLGPAEEEGETVDHTAVESNQTADPTNDDTS